MEFVYTGCHKYVPIEELKLVSRVGSSETATMYCHSNAISRSYQRACLSGLAGNEPGFTEVDQLFQPFWC